MRPPAARFGVLLATLACGYACGSSSSPITSHHDGGASSGGEGGGGSSGGDDGGISGSTGVVACGQPVDAGALAQVECALSMPVEGGLSTTIHVPNGAIACGSASDAQGVSELDFGTSLGDAGSGSVDAIITFESELPYDQVGTFPADVRVEHGYGDGGAAQWQTPPGACSIVVAGSLCIESTAGLFDGGEQARRILSGTGSCSQPAAPLAGNTAAAITIGSFAFVSSVGP